MEISYPVYRIGTEIPTQESGVSMYIRNLDNILSYKIVDDRNIPLDSLAKRRLKLLMDGVPLKKIGHAVFFLGDLVKLAKPQTWFIDSNGLLFQYRKQLTVPLLFKKIVKIIRLPTGGAILELDGIPSRFKCMFAPQPAEIYAGVLLIGTSYVLYGIYKEKYDNTRRRV